MLVQNLLDAGSSLGILGHHIQITAASGSWQLVTQAEVVHQVGDATHAVGIGAAVYLLVLLPRLANQASHLLEVLSLDSLIHIGSMGLHGA